VADGAGGVDTAAIRLTAGNAAPVAQILAPVAPLPNWRVGDVLQLSGSGSDPEQGNLTGDALEWEMILRHCSDETFLDCHSHTVSGANGNHVAFDAPDHEYPSYLRFRLTARDVGDATGVAELDLYPAVADVTMATVPPGLQLVVGGAAARTTPFVHKVIANGTFSVSAPAAQQLGADVYNFLSWSDGGAASHLVTLPNPGPATLTATYDADRMFRDGFE
jgi:hypothetical protein